MRENMEHSISAALTDFTRRYVECWQDQTGHPPASEELYGVSSPCIVEAKNDRVYWLPQVITEPLSLASIERALGIQLCPESHEFYTLQYAGDMHARWQQQTLTLLQAWSEDDFIRLQENLIGHLVTQKRLKLPPTLFIATTDSELAVISLCNISGNVLLEQFGSKQRQVLTNTLSEFLQALQPVISAPR